MMEFLDNLRAKPVHVRKQIAFVTTLVLSLMVASVWWNSWNNSGTTTPKKRIAESGAPSPWSVVVDTAKQVKTGMFSALQGATDQLQYVAQESLDGLPFTGEVQTAATANAPQDEVPAKDSVAASPEPVSPAPLGETIHTRPKLLDSTRTNGAQ